MTSEICQDSDFIILTTEDAALFSLWQSLNQHPALDVRFEDKAWAKDDNAAKDLRGQLLALSGQTDTEALLSALADFRGQVVLLVPNPLEMVRRHYNRLWWQSVGQAGRMRPSTVEAYFAQPDAAFYTQFEALAECLRLRHDALCVELRQNANSARHATLKRLCQSLGVAERAMPEPKVDYDDLCSEVFRQYEAPVIIEGTTLSCRMHYSGANPFDSRYQRMGQLPKPPKSALDSFQAVALDFYLLQDCLKGLDLHWRKALQDNVVTICHLAFELYSHRLRALSTRCEKHGLSGVDKALKQQIRQRLAGSLKSLYAQQPSWQKRWAA